MTFLQSISRYKQAIFVVSVLVIFAICGVFIAKNHTTLSQSFSVKPESFTELYFQNNEHILSKPSQILNYKAVPYTFSFTIHNKENKTMSYHYIVTLSGEQQKVIDTNTLVLHKDQSQTVQETFVLPNLILTKSKIDIKLTNSNEEIFFWFGGQSQ